MYNHKIISHLIDKDKYKHIKDIEQTNGIITMSQNSAYFHFSKNDIIALTHSLGHNNLTGTFLSYKKIIKNEQNKYKIIIGSDGLWDMILLKEDFNLLSKIKNSTELINIIKNRWNQTWLYLYKNFITTTSFEKNNIDDICIGLWYN